MDPRHHHEKTFCIYIRVSDPGGVDQDPDPTFKKKPDPDPTYKINKLDPDPQP